MAACSAGLAENDEGEPLDDGEESFDVDDESAASLDSTLIRPSQPPCPPGAQCGFEPLDPCAHMFCAFEKRCVVRDSLASCE